MLDLIIKYGGSLLLIVLSVFGYFNPKFIVKDREKEGFIRKVFIVFFVIGVAGLLVAIFK